MTNNRHLKSIVFFSLIIAHSPMMCMFPNPAEQAKEKTKKSDDCKNITIVETKTVKKINPLEKSSLPITPVPTTRGFGPHRSMMDWITPQEENLFADLQNKTFDVNNSSYHRKLSIAIEIFVNKKNDQRLTEMFEICRKDYRRSIKIEDSPALMAHQFLAEQNKNKQQALKIKLEEADKGAIVGINTALATLKNTLDMHINAIAQSLVTHNEAQEKDIKIECNEIKRLKKGLGHIHKLNRTFTKPDDAYCSDNEDQDPEDVTIFYNDTHILEKIGSDKKLAETKKRIQAMLQKLVVLNHEVQNIQELRY